jgi:hypothetical protein
MKAFLCQEQRMHRALHARWPYRRSHCRHDLHWLVMVHPRAAWCACGRRHPILVLPRARRRPGPLR